MTDFNEIYRTMLLGDIDEPDMGRYDRYFHRLRNAVLEYVKKALWKKQISIPKVGNELKRGIEEQFRKIIFRTLLLEMNVCDQLGELSGSTEEERYQSFVADFLADRKWLMNFCEEYPMLHDCLLQAMNNMVNHLTEAVERFYVDNDMLNQRYFPAAPCAKISEINGTGADGHRGGKSVLILKLDNGERIVYKPRSLAIDQGYQEVATWIADGIGVPYPWNWAWNRGEYGWNEWVAAKSCENEEQLGRYYFRNGILLAIGYLLGSGDIHFENLIADGEYPIVIDLEMGVGHRNPSCAVVSDEAQRLYMDSVLRTGLLPMFAWNENGDGVNVGAINAVGGARVPLEIPVVVQQGTVNMHIEYAHPTIKPGNNLATLRGDFIEPYQFVAQIEAGFERTYQFIMDHKAEVREKLERFMHVPVRFLANTTQVYSMLINTSYLPQYVRDEKARERALAQIKTGREQTAEDKWVAIQEIREMLNGDVPYFWYYAGETALYSGTGETYANYFRGTAVEEIANRLSNMNLENMKQQKRLIHATLSMSKQSENTKLLKTEGRNSEAEDRGLVVAEIIGSRMIEEVMWGENSETVSWLGIIVAGFRENGYLLRPMGPYLYDGWAGVAIFMSAMAKRTGKEKYAEVARKLRGQLFAHTDKFVSIPMSGNQCIGAYTGEASVAYAYQILYTMENDRQYLEYMERQCDALPKLIECDQNYDVLGGNAGAVLILLNAYKLTGKEKYLGLAKQAGDCLIDGAIEYEWGWGWKNPVAGTALTGFAHGASGIMLALAKLSAYTKEDKYEEMAHQAFLFEQHFYRAEKGDWMDLRSSDKSEKLSGSSTAWCHGWGGILTADRMAAEYIKADWKRELEQIPVKIMPKNRYRRIESSYSLCHGKFGNVALLYGMGEKELAKACFSETVRELVDESEEFRKQLGQQERENYGLMGGIAGIGLGCIWGSEEILKILCCEV